MVDTREILNFLECRVEPPDVRALNRLLSAYIQKVPWESVFRIVKRAKTDETAQCPRWPAEFWRDAIQSGGGGTCFENNYAFYDLLRSLGFSGYLTINDMGEQRGCHAAIVIHLNAQKYLVDVGIPLLKILPIDSGRVTARSTWLHTYSIHPDGANRFQVLRSRHPKPNIYTLLDEPIREPDYRMAIELDYGANGLFLERVIVVKIIGKRLWRFSSTDQPYRLEWFDKAGQGSVPVPPDQVASVLADQFQMDKAKIQKALEIVVG